MWCVCLAPQSSRVTNPVKWPMAGARGVPKTAPSMEKPYNTYATKDTPSLEKKRSCAPKAANMTPSLLNAKVGCVWEILHGSAHTVSVCVCHAAAATLLCSAFDFSTDTNSTDICFSSIPETVPVTLEKRSLIQYWECITLQEKWRTNRIRWTTGI